MNMAKFIHLKQNDDWKPFVQLFEHLDAYYDPVYVKLMAAKDQGTAEAVYFEKNGTRIFYPFIKRPYLEFFDIVTPYGYGGPVVEGDLSLLKDFYSHINQLAKEQGIITEKIKCHPLLTPAKELSEIMELENVQQTTAVDLTSSYEEIRQGYSSSNKRNINKAKRKGVQVIVDEDLRYLKDFQHLYEETMTRNEADTSFYFPDDYYEEQMKESILYEPKLLIARHEDKTIAGAIVLLGKQLAHYHLGASSSEYLPLRANNLLFDEMVQYCQKQGHSLLHLGGGTGGDDGLFRFKSSFTNGNHFDFKIAKHVLDQDVYRQLTKDKTLQQQHYFPGYRY